MAVFRVERTRDYTVMCNHHLKDSNLSLKAKGLLSMMLSLPDEWNYTTRGLAAICKEGVDAIGKTLKELELAGYIINISIGKNFYTNHNVTILDGAKVTFGDNVFIAPNCVFSTAGHAIDSEQRGRGLEIALPITVGDNVWIGTNVSVLPGVTIGSDTIIGAGSVVNKSIPSGVIAAGNPCKVIRKITDADKDKYPRWSGTADK